MPKMTEEEFARIVNGWPMEKLVLMAEECLISLHDKDRSDIVGEIVDHAISCGTPLEVFLGETEDIEVTCCEPYMVKTGWMAGQQQVDVYVNGKVVGSFYGENNSEAVANAKLIIGGQWDLS